MQLHALDSEANLISSERADKLKEYHCIECKHIVKRRGGAHRRTHFYHIQSTETCHLSKKSMTHLQVQWYVFSLFSKEEIRLEHRFPEINRIADIAWIKEKIIFEVQCSPMTKEEALARTQDYKKIGYHVIWILHDARYNQYRLSSIELGLKHHEVYFTNINCEGLGYIYDQIDFLNKGIRKKLSSPLKINLNIKKKFPNESLPSLIKNRKKRIYFFEGDAIDLYKKKDSRVLDLVRNNENQNKISYTTLFYHYLLLPYRLIFQLLLEKFCR